MMPSFDGGAPPPVPEQVIQSLSNQLRRDLTAQEHGVLQAVATDLPDQDRYQALEGNLRSARVLGEINADQFQAASNLMIASRRLANGMPPLDQPAATEHARPAPRILPPQGMGL